MLLPVQHVVRNGIQYVFRYFFKTMQGKIVGLFVMFMTVVFVVSCYAVRHMSQNAMEQEKEAKLLHIAIAQDRLLGEQDYDAILAEAGASHASPEEQIAVLNRALAGRADTVAALLPGMGVGYYSLRLNAILAYGPSATYSDRIGVSIAPDHPGHVVMRENRAMVRIGTMVRGHIMNAMHPVTRGGKVIGYTWANELTSDIEQAYREFSDTVIAFFVVFYIASFGIAIALAHRMIRNIDTVIAGVRHMSDDLTTRIAPIDGELGDLAKNINNMAEDLEKNAKEHDALLRAEAVNVAQRDFLSRMSHEIRTPMNAVIGMTGIARKTDDAGKIQDCLRKIGDAANHLLGVINDVLDMSKIEAGKLELSETHFAFREMLHQVVTVAGFKIEECHQHFTMELGADVPEYVITDRQRLAQVITNLLSNANKFTSEGGNIRLRVKRLADEDGMCRLRIEVQDDGIGISQEQQDRLFKSFEQADNSISRKYGGTGLGLAISKRIVDMMRGKAWIQSELGHGACFIVEIGVKPGEPDGSESAAVAHTETAEDRFGTLRRAPALFAGKRILLAEDVAINREIVLALLEPTRIAIDCVENGAEAVRVFSEAPEKYDLMFMDVQMPEMDGYEATRRIRSLEFAQARTIPIIAMTANVFQNDIDKCLAAGMNSHVGKPLDFNDILRQLRQYLA